MPLWAELHQYLNIFEDCEENLQSPLRLLLPPPDLPHLEMSFLSQIQRKSWH